MTSKSIGRVAERVFKYLAISSHVVVSMKKSARIKNKIRQIVREEVEGKESEKIVKLIYHAMKSKYNSQFVPTADTVMHIF